MKGVTNMKTILGALALFICTGVAQASLVTIETNYSGDNTVTISGYENRLTGSVTSGLFGSLFATSEVRATFTYLGQKSGHINLFIGDSDLLLETGTVGSTSISSVMSANSDLDFHFLDRDTMNVVSNSDGRSFEESTVLPPSFAILNSNVNAAFGNYDYILGFNDDWNDADYDDFVVGLNVAATPLPPAAWLFGSALVGLGAVVRRSRTRSKAEAVAA